jgi:hypothetical protein
MTLNIMRVNKILMMVVALLMSVTAFSQNHRWWIADQWAQGELPLELSVTRNLAMLSIAGWGIEVDENGVRSWKNYREGYSAEFTMTNNTYKPGLSDEDGAITFDNQFFTGVNSIMDSDSAYTVIVHLKNPNFTGQERIFMSFRGSDDHQFILMSNENDVNKRYEYYFGTNSGAQSGATGYDYDKDSYHTVAWGFRENGPIQIYVDDQREVNNTTGYTWDNGGATYSAQLGSGVSNVNPLEGEIKFVAIYNTLLDSTEIVTVSEELRAFVDQKDEMTLSFQDDFFLQYYGNNAVFDETSEKTVILQDKVGGNEATQINKNYRPTYNFSKKRYEFSKADSTFMTFDNPFTSAGVSDSSFTLMVAFNSGPDVSSSTIQKIFTLTDGNNNDNGFYFTANIQNDTLIVLSRTASDAATNWADSVLITSNTDYVLTMITSESGATRNYLNAELIGDGVVGDGNWWGTPNEAYGLGTIRDSSSLFFDGDIYFFGIADRKFDELEVKLTQHEIKDYFGIPSDFSVPLSDIVDLTENPVVAVWDFDDIVRSENATVPGGVTDRLDNMLVANYTSSTRYPRYRTETVNNREYPSLAFDGSVDGEVDFGRTNFNAYFLDTEFSMVTIIKRNQYNFYDQFWTMRTGGGNPQYGFREKNSSNYQLLINNVTVIDNIPNVIGTPYYWCWNYTDTNSELFYGTTPSNIVKRSASYSEAPHAWSSYNLNWAARNSGGNDPSQVSYIDKVLVFEDTLRDSEIDLIFKFWPFLEVPDHLMENFTSQDVVTEFLPLESLVNDTISVDEYYEPIEGRTWIDGGSVSRFRLLDSPNSPNFFLEGSLYVGSSTWPDDMDTTITVVARVDGNGTTKNGTGYGGQLFANFTLNQKKGIRWQSFRFYHSDDANGLQQIEINTNYKDDRIYVSNIRPEGDRFLHEDLSSWFNTSYGSYTPTQLYNSFCLGCTNTNRDEWKSRIYGAYVLRGSPTLQEAKDMIANWDYYHTRRVERTDGFSISENIDNNLIAAWKMDTNYMAMDTMVYTGRYHIDSIECILGDRAGDSNFDLIETGTGNVFDIILEDGSTGRMYLEGTSIKTRGSVSMGTNLSYVVFWNQGFTTGASTLVSEFTATGNTTGYSGNTHTADGMSVYNNNSLNSSFVTGYPEGTSYFGRLGWDGNSSTWNIKQKTDNNFQAEDMFHDYDFTDYSSGSFDHGTGLVDFDQPVFNGRDGGLYDVGNISFHKWIFIFGGHLAEEELIALAKAVFADKNIID